MTKTMFTLAPPSDPGHLSWLISAIEHGKSVVPQAHLGTLENDLNRVEKSSLCGKLNLLVLGGGGPERASKHRKVIGAPKSVSSEGSTNRTN